MDLSTCYSFCYADVAELEVISMAFSPTSWRFVTISGEPDFCVVSSQIIQNFCPVKFLPNSMCVFFLGGKLMKEKQ